MFNSIFRVFTLVFLGLMVQTEDVIAQTYRNASDFVNPEPLAGFRQLQSSEEIYFLWAEDNIFKNQILDYFPTPQADASLLAGSIKDVFTPSKIEATNGTNETTRVAVAAADVDADGIDEIIKVSTTGSFEILLNVTTVGSELEVTGNTSTTQIVAQVAQNVRSKIKVLTSNFDDDDAEEIVIIWPEGSATDPDRVQIRIFDFISGRMEELLSYEYDRPLKDFDAVISDLDLDAIPEIVLATQEKNNSSIDEIKVSIIRLEENELVLKNRMTISQFSNEESLSSDLSFALAQGDFDADVAPEIAIALRQPDLSLTGQKVQIKIIQSVDNTSTASNVSVFEELILTADHTLIDTFLDAVNAYEPIYIASGDLSGDGDDELVVFSQTRNMLFYLNIDTLSQIKPKLFSLTRGGNDDPIFCFTRGGVQTIKLEVGDLNRDGIAELVHTIVEGCTEDIYSENINGARIACDIYDLSEGDGPVLTAFYNSNASSTRYLGVLPAAFVLGDFNGDNFRLGKGRYFRRSNISQPIIILNAPPIHFDQIGHSLYDVNKCYNDQECSFASTYLRSSTVSMKTSTRVSSSWSASVTVEGSVTADAGVVSSSIEASVTRRYGEKFSKYRSSGQRLEISTEVSAIEDDQIYASVSDYDIWEYPVYEKDSLIAHLLSVTPTILENRWFPSKSFNAFDYLPDHEVGNILSYRQIKPEFSSVARTISSDAFTLSANSSNKWTVNQQSFRESGSSFEQEIGIEASATVETEAKFKVFGGSLAVTVEGEYEGSSLSTHKTRVSEEIEIAVQMGGVDESLGEVKYSVNPYCYWAKNGALVVDYTVQPEVPTPGASDTWWSSNYSQKSDPAFILPWRFDPEKGLTLQDEQVKRFQSKSIGFSNSAPGVGDTLTIYVEVHNWSLIPTTNPVEVAFYLCDPTDENNRIEDIAGNIKIATRKALDPRGNDVLAFNWIVQEGLPTFPRIYARIDPDNLEDEIHEENNFGFNILNMSTNIEPCPAPAIITSSKLSSPVLSNVEVFPNPFSEKIIFDFSAPNAGVFGGKIFNSLGQEVLKWDPIYVLEGDHQEIINTSDLSEGIYFYKIYLKDAIATGTLIKK